MQEFSPVLKNYRFVALWISQIFSQLTMNILSFIILIHIFERTGSTIASSLLWVAYALPAIIFGPIAAAWSDLLEKRRLLMITNLLQSLVVVGFAVLLYRQVIYLSYVVVFLYSLINQLYVPAEAASMPLYVKEENLPGANSLFLITQQSSLVLGFALAGILDQILGFRPTLFFVSFLLFLAFLSVSFLPPKKPKEKLPEDFEKRVTKFFGQIMEGYNFIKNTNQILFLFLLLIGVQVTLTVIVTNLPRIALDIMRVPISVSSLVVVLPAGVGAIIGTVLIPKILAKGTSIVKVILNSLFAFGFSITMVSIFVPLFTEFWVRIFIGGSIFAISGMSAVGIIVPAITYIQNETPKEMMGRVFGNFWFLTTVITVIPVIFSATITDLLGVRYLVFLLGLVSFGCFLLVRNRLNKIL